MHRKVFRLWLVPNVSFLLFLFLLLTVSGSRVYGQQPLPQITGPSSSNDTPNVLDEIGRLLNSTLDTTNFEITLRSIEEQSKPNQNLSSKYAIHITTNRPNYIIGQQIQISVWVFDPNSNQGKADVNIEVKYSGKTVYDATALIAKNRLQRLPGPNTNSDGTYNITATTSLGGKSQTAWTTIKVDNLFNTTPAHFVYLGVGFVGGLTILIIKGTRSHSVSEIIRFICITGIVLSAVASLLLTDLQIGFNSPVGLIIRNVNPSNQSGGNFADWALNIGGSQLNNFTDGISIPVYVVVFGIVGGYLRYLYKTARLRSINSPLRELLLFRWESVPGPDSSILRSFLKERLDIDWITSQEFTKSEDTNSITLASGPDEVVTIILDGKYAKVRLGNREIYHFTVLKEDKGVKIYQTASWRSWLFYQSLEDLALLFLAPLLAVAVWFLLVQAGTTSKYTLALTSLTIGLVTDEAIRALLRFIRRILGTVERGQRDPVTEPIT